TITAQNDPEPCERCDIFKKVALPPRDGRRGGPLFAPPRRQSAHVCAALAAVQARLAGAAGSRAVAPHVERALTLGRAGGRNLAAPASRPVPGACAPAAQPRTSPAPSPRIAPRPDSGPSSRTLGPGRGRVVQASATAKSWTLDEMYGLFTGGSFGWT